MKISAVTWLAVILVALSCSSGGKSGENDIDSGKVGDAGDGAGGDTQGCEPGISPLETGVSETDLLAGESVVVSCFFEGCKPWEQDGLDYSVGGEEKKDYTRSGDTVTFTKPGNYEIACSHTASGNTVQDDTPAVVVVEPGLPVLVTTSIETPEVKAGTTVPVECHAYDEFDNEVFGQWTVVVSPAQGVKTTGQLLMPATAGKYEVVCVLDGAHSSQKAASLNVIPNVPARIYTKLGSDTVVAGESTTISCVATDAYENKVAGFPMVVAVPGDISLKGLAVSGTKTGQYELKCLPQGLDWSLFKLYPALLKVIPGAPAKITLTKVPDKVLYNLMDKLLIQVAVRDAYDNLVPDVQFQPVEISPVEAVVEVKEWNYKFVQEGQIQFTVRLKDNPSIFQTLTVTVDGSGPLLSLDFPERGATVDLPAPVNLTGSVSDQVTGLATFKINEEDVEVTGNNTFAHPYTPAHAVNLLVAEATDQGGQKSRTTRGFAWSDKFHPPEGGHGEAFISDALQMFLSAAFVDDGNHDKSNPDDLATLMELVLANLNIGALIPNPVYNANNYKVFVKNVTFNAPTVSMTLVEGGLKLHAKFSNFSADVDAIGSCKVVIIDLCPDVSGKLKIDYIDLFATVLVSLDENKNPKASISEFHLGLGDIKLSLSGLGSLLNPIVNGMIGLFESQIEDALESQMKGMIPDLIADLFGQFQLDQNIEVPPLVEGADATTINLKTRYSVLDFAPGGITMLFDALAFAPKKVLHEPLGSLARGGCAGPSAPVYKIGPTGEVTVALFDDLLNQILFSIWWGGSLNLKLTEEQLGSVGEQLAGYGITDPKINLDFFLSPMFTDCPSLESLRLGIGDLYIQADFKMVGQPISMGLFVSALADASIALSQSEDGPSFEIQVKGVKNFQYEIVSITQGFEELVPIIEELLAGDTLQGALDSLTDLGLGGIKLPEIDLGSLVPGVPPGTKLTITPTQLSRVSGFTQLAGKLE